MIKKALSIVLLLSLLIMIFISCSPAESDPNSDNNSTTTTVSNGADDPVTEETKIITYLDANLPDEDFGGYTFTILTTDPGEYAWRMVDVDEISGEPLNDSIYERNEKIESVYNIKIDTAISTAIGTDVPKVVNANDDVYDFVFATVSNQLTFAQNGYLLDYNIMPYIDLDREWWDQSIIRDLTILEQLYMLTGDISPLANVRTYSLVFNKDLCAELGLDLPYEYVLNGSWTMDMFAEYAKGVNRDLNGDGVMNYEDQWGYFSQYGNSYMMFTAGGGRVADLDSNGIPQITMDNEKNIDIIIKALHISNDKEATLMANPYVSSNGGSWQAASTWFANGGSLLRSSVFEPVPRDYRSMETDFGILPYPKYTEQQESYYSLAEAGSANVFSIPVTIGDMSRTGLIIEALAAQSVSTVSNAFYDVCLDGKYIRDVESEAMIDLIFDNKVFDLGYILNIGGFQGIIQALEQAGSDDVISKYESIKSASQTTLDKYVISFE